MTYRGIRGRFVIYALFRHVFKQRARAVGILLEIKSKSFFESRVYFARPFLCKIFVLSICKQQHEKRERVIVKSPCRLVHLGKLRAAEFCIRIGFFLLSVVPCVYEKAYLFTAFGAVEKRYFLLSRSALHPVYTVGDLRYTDKRRAVFDHQSFTADIDQRDDLLSLSRQRHNARKSKYRASEIGRPDLPFLYIRKTFFFRFFYRYRFFAHTYFCVKCA